jgi:hypothetical protein
VVVAVAAAVAGVTAVAAVTIARSILKMRT